MLVGDNDNFVEVLLVEATPQALPGAGDLRLRVRVTFSTFHAEYDRVWVTASDFQAFLSELKALEERRQGSATLASMSPNELILQVHSTDRAGHMAVTGQLGRWCYARGNGMLWCQLPFDFALSCPSQLPQFLAEFRAMAASPEPRL
jgi:hypothetical protein